MNDIYEAFTKTIEAENTRRVVRSLKEIGEYDYDSVGVVDLEQIILNMKPSSPKAITTIAYVIGLYAKYLNNDNLYHMALSIDRASLWLRAKTNAPKKFISHDTYEHVYKEVGVYEEYNSFYMQTLFRSIYEGVYSEDLSVIKNLRASDITDNIVALKEDNGNVYFLQVSDKLANDLIELSKIDIWERRNRYGTAKIKTVGLEDDSCFKAEIRKEVSSYAFQYSYYRILRKVAKEYLEYKLLPLDLFVSGIVYRIGIELKDHGITLEEAFSEGNKSRVVSGIIREELDRCNYRTTTRNFREMVQGHIDAFV